MRPWRRLALRLGVSLGLLALLLVWVDLGALLRRLGDTRPTLLVVVLLLLTLDRVLMAAKWWLLLRARGLPVSLWGSLRAYYVASFAGLFLPMTLGADAVRVMTLPRAAGVSELVASIAVERGIGAGAQAILAVLALGLLAREAGLVGGELWWAVGGTFFAVVILFPLSFALAGWGSRWLDREGIPGKVLGPLLTAYAAYRAHPRVLWGFFGLTLLEGFFPVTIHFVAARALDLQLPFLLFLATIPIVFLVGRLPVSLGGIGVVESSFVYLASVLGVTPADGFAIALLAEAALLVSLLPGAVAYLLPAGEPLRTRA